MHVGGLTTAATLLHGQLPGHEFDRIRNLTYDDLTGGNFAGQNLTNANFALATLTGRRLHRRRSARSRLLTLHHDNRLHGGAALLHGQLPGPRFDRDRFGCNDLSGWNFAGQNLTNANFGAATLTDADFTGAECAWSELRLDSLTDAA